jgi:hypothetical protein
MGSDEDVRFAIVPQVLVYVMNRRERLLESLGNRLGELNDRV